MSRDAMVGPEGQRAVAVFLPTRLALPHPVARPPAGHKNDFHCYNFNHLPVPSSKHSVRPKMSKISVSNVRTSIQAVLQGCEDKHRNFNETIERELRRGICGKTCDGGN